MNNITEQTKLHNITLALAGILQVAVLVRDLVKTGTADETAFHTSISSVYKIDVENVTAVYGKTSNLRLGLTALIHLLGPNKTGHDSSISRYVVSLIHLERKLMRNKEILKLLGRRVKYASSQAVYFSETHPTVLASLADIYLSTLGALPFRVHIYGQAKYLNQEDIIHKVRALMLAGVRSAVLWRQVGGTRLQLLFWRNKLIQMAKQILAGN